MKLKLIAIVFLALLLCAMVPMTASAAKETTTIQTTLFWVTAHNAGYFAKAGGAGKLVIDKQTDTYTITSAKLLPGQTYKILVTPTRGSFGAQVIGSVTVGTDGTIPANQPLKYPWTAADVAGWLDAGGFAFADSS